MKHRFWTSVFPEKLKKECNSYLGKINCENYEDRERCSDKHAELGERFKLVPESQNPVMIQPRPSVGKDRRTGSSLDHGPRLFAVVGQREQYWPISGQFETTATRISEAGLTTF